MSTMVDITTMADEKFLVDPYLNWVKDEGIPVVEDFGVDIKKVETKPWARYGVPGCFVHLKGRGDFLAMYVIDIPKGGKTTPQKMMAEEVFYVIDGHGSTVVESYDGKKHSFEWGPRSLFALPLNCRYQHFNGSGAERARLYSCNDLPLVMNLYRNHKFVFDNNSAFPEREGDTSYFAGEGEFIPKIPGRHMWETNYVTNLSTFELQAWSKRGAGGSNIMLSLADGTIHAHVSEMPVGTYKKGHRHGADFHVMCCKGDGYSLLWYEFEKDLVRVDWDHGVVFAPPDGMFHQHFNAGPEPARYLAIAMGSMRYPLLAEKRAVWLGMDVSIKDGGKQIEYEDQHPKVHPTYLEALAKHGAKSKMGKFIDETKYKNDPKLKAALSE
jgi:oxalate decarboxylase/phosphoglucose isomerase-like protein (cupin superfamily)